MSDLLWFQARYCEKCVINRTSLSIWSYFDGYIICYIASLAPSCFMRGYVAYNLLQLTSCMMLRIANTECLQAQFFFHFTKISFRNDSGTIRIFLCWIPLGNHSNHDYYSHVQLSEVPLPTALCTYIPGCHSPPS